MPWDSDPEIRVARMACLPLLAWQKERQPAGIGPLNGEYQLPEGPESRSDHARWVGGPMRTKPRELLPVLGVTVLLATLGVLGLRIVPALRPVEADVPAEPAPTLVRLVAVGDIIMHAPIIAAARDERTGTYDFRPVFAEIEPFLSRADLAVAVLETTLGGAGRGFTGYPRFNSPDQIAEALLWAGVDVAFTAHNHMLDQGIEGLFRTVDRLDGLGLAHVGSAGTPDPAARVVLKEAGGIRFAFLSYTTSTNGLPVPAGRSWAVNLYDRELVRGDVAAARRAGAEIVVCALHAGVEYQRQPDQGQRDIAAAMVEAGVDVVLGSHPHVIEPVETRSYTGPDGIRRTAFIAYSLGNLVSNQRRRYTDCGLMVTLTAAKEQGRPARIIRACWRPLWVHKYESGGRFRFRILPVYAPSSSPYAGDESLAPAHRERLAQVWEETLDLLGPQVVAVAE